MRSGPAPLPFRIQRCYRRAATVLAGLLAGAATVAICLAGGCQWFVDDADREVYRLIDRGQRAALNRTSDANLGRERSPVAVDESAYQFEPHPVDYEVPPVLGRPPTTRPEQAVTRPSMDLAQSAPPTTQEASGPTATRPTEPLGPRAAQWMPNEDNAELVTLESSLAYAFRHARAFQSAKEDLYLAALALSLERFLWTPQWMAEIRSQYANYGEIRNFDHAMDAVAEVSAQQRLPYGGQVTARVINTLMRDLTHHLTTGETGQMVLEANIPLLRGAGRAAYESRYQAERDLIYAVRTLERFRQSQAVEIASGYFGLQALRQQIINAAESVDAFADMVKRAESLWKAGRIINLEVQRAEADRLDANNQLVNTITAYLSALDAFKVRLAMPIDKPITVELPPEPSTERQGRRGLMPAESLAQTVVMPEVSEAEAVTVALKYRLDLLNDLDRVGDAGRGVQIAENNLLPDLAAWGRVQFDTDPTELKMFDYNTDRTTWRGGMSLGLPLNRQAERNALRAAIIQKRRAERNYELGQETVRQQVRQAMRRVAQQRETLRIQLLNRDLARQRLVAAQLRFLKGQVSNREVVEAQGTLLGALNQLARSQADLGAAILEFRRDTGTLRVDDEGKWAPLLVQAAPEQ